MPAFHLSTFECDVTPPVGHPLCGGWIEPARGVDDPLRALGIVLLGPARPVVLCAVDWCGVRNQAHLVWRLALAEAAHTVPENVALHCVHQHNAPFADLRAEMLSEAAGATRSLDPKFFQLTIKRTAEAVRNSLTRTAVFTHLGMAKAKVDRVASNRRILGADGSVKQTRFSATKDPTVRAEPEGLIDPWLRTVSFWNGDRPLVALHYYATHPMSYYGDGRVSSDFCGLARQNRQTANPHVFQIYFTGCAGNITAGKYNDGSHGNRDILRDRVFDAMNVAWDDTRRSPVRNWRWRIEKVKLPARAEPVFREPESHRVLEDPKQSAARRGNAAFQLAWLERINQAIDLSCLELDGVSILHLPGEPFIEYQLHAQEMRSDRFVCVAGYGDGGPGYIPTKSAYLEGGYEPTVALAAPGTEAILNDAISKLLSR
jgi:hypothetical protein